MDFHTSAPLEANHTFIAIIEEANWRLTLPFNRPVKQAYVMQALRAIDEIIALQNADESEDDADDDTI